MGMRIFNYFWEKIKISICRPPTRFCSFVEMQIIKNELRLVCQQEIASNDKAENADSKLCSSNKDELLQVGIFFLIHLFAREI